MVVITTVGAVRGEDGAGVGNGIGVNALGAGQAWHLWVEEVRRRAQ